MGKWIFLLLIVTACTSDSQPKPIGYLRLDYPEAEYTRSSEFKSYSFEYNSFADLKYVSQSSPKLFYPKMKATLFLNYSPIKSNLDSLLNDAYKMPYKHISMAESIPEKVFINQANQAYGTLFSVVGNAASQHQFFLTDSTKHFLVGSVYFYAKPNYDSLYPAVNYLKKDIVHLMETLKWQ
ncbi:MAG: gliding motility lipoprotein GldD [Flavobacteriaceae bacterium]